MVDFAQLADLSLNSFDLLDIRLQVTCLKPGPRGDQALAPERSTTRPESYDKEIDS